MSVSTVTILASTPERAAEKTFEIICFELQNLLLLPKITKYIQEIRLSVNGSIVKLLNCFIK